MPLVSSRLWPGDLRPAVALACAGDEETADKDVQAMLLARLGRPSSHAVSNVRLAGGTLAFCMLRPPPGCVVDEATEVHNLYVQHPRQVPEVIARLRQQCVFARLIDSCFGELGPRPAVNAHVGLPKRKKKKRKEKKRK
jgi:hypothetical protein